MGLVVQLLLAFSLPIITVALFQLLFDREFGTHFYDPTAGGDPVYGSSSSGCSGTRRCTC